MRASIPSHLISIIGGDEDKSGGEKIGRRSLPGEATKSRARAACDVSALRQRAKSSPSARSLVIKITTEREIHGSLRAAACATRVTDTTDGSSFGIPTRLRDNRNHDLPTDTRAEVCYDLMSEVSKVNRGL